MAAKKSPKPTAVKTRRAPAADAILAEHAHPLADVIEPLRALILAVDPEIVEGVKWNAPSYAHAGADRFTFNLRAPAEVRLILHCGAKKRGGKGRLLGDTFGLVESGVLEWADDERAIVRFASAADVQQAKAALTKLLRAWLAAAPA